MWTDLILPGKSIPIDFAITTNFIRTVLPKIIKMDIGQR